MESLYLLNLSFSFGLIPLLWLKTNHTKAKSYLRDVSLPFPFLLLSSFLLFGSNFLLLFFPVPHILTLGSCVVCACAPSYRSPRPTWCLGCICFFAWVFCRTRRVFIRACESKWEKGNNSIEASLQLRGHLGSWLNGIGTREKGSEERGKREKRLKIIENVSLEEEALGMARSGPSNLPSSLPPIPGGGISHPYFSRS